MLRVGAGGTPPYLVRFTDGTEKLMLPGPDCINITPDPAAASQRAATADSGY